MRGIARVEDGKVTLQSRSGKSEFSDRFGAVAEQLALLPDCVLDGELVVMDEQGWTNGLPAGMKPGDGSYVIFDCLEVQGTSVRSLGLRERRDTVESLLAYATVRAAHMLGGTTPNLLKSPVWDDGEKLLAWTAEHGLEGIVAKRDGSTYRDGYRGESWLKIKARAEQEFVVCGWTEGKGERAGRLGGLVIGYYAGPDAPVRGQGRRQARRTRTSCASSMEPGRLDDARRASSSKPGVNWVEPQVVMQVQFQAWTADGKLKQPIMKRIRSDKARARRRAGDVGFESTRHAGRAGPFGAGPFFVCAGVFWHGGCGPPSVVGCFARAGARPGRTSGSRPRRPTPRLFPEAPVAALKSVARTTSPERGMEETVRTTDTLATPAGQPPSPP